MRDERACCFAGATHSRMWLNNVAAAILAAGKPGCPLRRSRSSKHRKAPPAGARHCSAWQDATLTGRQGCLPPRRTAPRALCRARTSRRICATALTVAFFTIGPLLAGEHFSVSMPGWIGSLSFSPDGKRLAVGCADSSAHVLEVETGKEQALLLGHEDYVASVAFAPDGRTLATASYDHTARVWDLESRRTRHMLRGHRGVVMSVAFSPDGKWLATGSIDATVKLWNAATGRLRATLRGHKSWINSVAFSSDNQWLVSGSSDSTIKLWRVRSRSLAATIDATDAEVRSVAISPDGQTLAAGIRYGTLKTWNLATREPQLNFKAHEGDVWSLAFSPNGKMLISGDGDWDKPSQVKIRDAATARLRRTLSTSGEVLAVACSSDGRTLAAGCADGTVKVWSGEVDLP